MHRGKVFHLNEYAFHFNFFQIKDCYKVLLIIGFIPTFGPAFVHLYGSTRDYSLIDENSELNDGLGEGVSYRGRLLIAIKTDLSDSIDTAPSEVELEPTQTINEVSNHQYLLSGEKMHQSGEGENAIHRCLGVYLH